MPTFLSPTEEDRALFYNFENEISPQFHARRIIASNTIIYDAKSCSRSFNSDFYITKESIRNYFNNEILPLFNDLDNIETAKKSIEALIPQVEKVIDSSKLMKVTLDKDHYPDFDSDDIYLYARVVLSLTLLNFDTAENKPIEWDDTYDLPLLTFEKILYKAHNYIDLYEDDKFLHPIFTSSFAIKIALVLHTNQLLFINEFTDAFGIGIND